MDIVRANLLRYVHFGQTAGLEADHIDDSPKTNILIQS